MVGCWFQFLKTGLQAVAENGADIKMDKWHFFYVDERCVPLDHDDSNHKNAAPLYKKPWSTVLDENIHTADPSLGPKEMAEDYQRKIEAFFGGADVRFRVWFHRPFHCPCLIPVVPCSWMFWTSHRRRSLI